MPLDNLPVTGFAADPEAYGSSTAAQVFDRNRRVQKDAENVMSREMILDDLYERRIVDVQKATGILLPHPRRSEPTPDDVAEYEAENDRRFNPTRSRLELIPIMERRFHGEIDRLAEQNPDKAGAIRADKTIWTEAAERITASKQAAERATAGHWATLSLPLIGDLNPVAMAGGLSGMAQDPFNYPLLAMGPAGQASRSILWNASRQAAAGALQQTAVEPIIASWHREIGLKYGWDDAAAKVAMGGLFGGLLDAGGRSLGRAALGRPMGGIPEPVRPGAAAPEVAPQKPRLPADLDGALEAAARALPEDHVVRRAAQNDGPALIELAEKLVPDDDAAVRGALDAVRHETLQEAGIAERLRLAAGDDKLAERFRADMAREQLEASLRHVSDPEQHPPSFLAPSDAHPSGIRRVDTEAPGVRRTEFLEPVPVDHPVRLALREGDLDPVAAAGVIRERPELAVEVPLTTETARGIHALSRLSGDGFARVADGRIAPDLAVIVADAAPAIRHAELLDRLAEARPADHQAARVMVARMVQQPIDHGTAGMLLGGDAGATAGVRASAEWAKPGSIAEAAKKQADLLAPLAERLQAIEDVQAQLRQPVEGGGGVGLPPGIRQTIDLPGFGTPAYEAGRRFVIDGRPVVGYPAALKHLRAVAENAAGPAGVAYERRATIISGPPGAGKSTIVKTLARMTRAAEVSSDEPKFLLPEMKQFGAGFVHEEASVLAKKVQSGLAIDGANIVIEKLGNPKSIGGLVAGLSAAGYETRVVEVTAPRDVLVGRIASRYAKTGRNVPEAVLDEALANIGQTLDVLRRNDSVRGIVSIDNSGAVPYIRSGQEVYGEQFQQALDARVRQPGILGGTGGPGHGQGVLPEDGSGGRGPPHSGVRSRDGGRPQGASRGQEPIFGHAEEVSPPELSLKIGGLGGTRYAPGFVAAEDAIRDALLAKATATLPRGVRLAVEDRIRAGGYELNGYFHRGDNLLAVALDAGDPLATFSHERVHALKSHGLFTDSEWSLLVDAAGKARMRQDGMGHEALQAYREQLTPAMVKESLVARGVAEAASMPWKDLEAALVKAKLYDPKDPQGSLGRAGLWDEARLQALLDEEAVAHLAERWRSGEKVPARIARVLERVMEFLERVRNVLAGHGFQTLDDIFHRIDSGEVAMRVDGEASSAPSTRPALDAAKADADAAHLVSACKN